MWKKIIFGLLLIAGIAGGIYWFTYTKEINTPVSNAINAIPNTAAIIFESKQTKKTWEKISKTNAIWEELLSTQTFAKLNSQGKYIDSLINTNKQIAQFLNNGSIFVSAHVSGANTFGFLYVYSLPNLGSKSTLEEFIKKINSATPPTYRDYDGVNIATIYPTSNDSLSYVVLKGILMISSKQNLVEAGIRQLKSGISIVNDKNFSKIITTAGKNVDANVYINYKNFPGILTNFIAPHTKKEINAFADFADYSGWDVSIKPNALMFNGFTQANDSSVNFLNLFINQKPQEIELTKVIPSKTALLLFYGISNVKTFQHDYQKYLNTKKYSSSYTQRIHAINKKYKIDIEQLMLEWIDNEIGLVITEPPTKNYANNSYAVIHSNNIDEATTILSNLADSISKKEHLKFDTTSYKNHTITHLNLPHILPLLFGWTFDKISNNYFTTIGDYIVFSNTGEALRYFINNYENNKTLAKDKNYQAFSENISNEANVYVYSSIARSTNIYSSFITEELAKDMEGKQELLDKFEAAGIQFTASKNLFYSNIYLKYNPLYKQESGTIWESKLDTSVSTKPHLLINHNTKAKEIFVQDDANKIYLISNTGKIIWTKQLNEKIMSDVIQVDVLKNNKLQILFSTRNSIYMYDRNGKDMRGFPVRLKSAATNAISVFDYEKNRDYRIFIACESNKIVCYKANGEEVTNFKFDRTNSDVRIPLQYFSINNKDHICAIDVKGKVYLLNRKGETQTKINESLAKDIRNFYIEPGKDNNNTFIITADTLGTIIRMSISGNKERIKILPNGLETSPYFAYADINNDNTKEYIFLTNTELKVFAKDKSLIIKYEFKENVVPQPDFFTFPDGKVKIGVLSKAKNELYLFNDNGSLYKGFPIPGNTVFSIGDLNNDGFFNLITGSSDNSIYVYQLE